jgi:hypothetical protein
LEFPDIVDGEVGDAGLVPDRALLAGDTPHDVLLSERFPDYGKRRGRFFSSLRNVSLRNDLRNVDVWLMTVYDAED